MAANRRPLRSGTPVDKLFDDLLIDILVRLPNPRSVSRCKLVCKRWSLLLSSPGFNRRFVSDHWSRNQQPPLLLSSDDRESNILSFLPMPPSTVITWRRYFGILDSHNDLVLCGFEGVTPYNHAPELYRSYFVCNPFSKQWVALPLAPQVPVTWTVAAARLVCEPRGSANLALGDVGQCLVYSEYRFRVVCIYGDTGIGSTMLRVFSSDTGEWTKEILSIPNHMVDLSRNVVSCNGELYWVHQVPGAPDGGMRPIPPLVVAFNPFRPDMPFNAIRAPRVEWPARWTRWDISFSQGALHAVLLLPSRAASSVWRLEPDGKFWRKVCEGMVNIPCGPSGPPGLQLDPRKPEVMVWLSYVSPGSGVWTCNLETRGEPEFFTETTIDKLHWKMLHAQFACWPTPIPRYEKLRAMYDGSYNCWVQSKSTIGNNPQLGVY